MATMAMVDAAFDNYIFDATLLRKKIAEAKRQLDAFDTTSTKKRKITNGMAVNLNRVGKASNVGDNGSSEKWNALRETAQKVVAETGNLASVVERTGRVEGD